MKIALVCNAYPPEFVGGTELVVAAQAQALVEAGHEVRVVCGSQEQRNGFRPFTETVEGVEVIRIVKTKVESSSAHWQFARMVRVVSEAVDGFDLVHVHHWASISGDLVRRLSRTHPVVLTLHDYYASCPRFFRSPPGGVACPTSRPTSSCVQCVAPLIGDQLPADIQQRLTERWKNFRAEISDARYVISPSRSLAVALGRQMELDSSNWQVIPHGLCQELAPVTRGSRTAGPLTILSFGNRSEVKGTLELVRAAALAEPGTVRLILPGAEVQPGFDDELRAAAGNLELELPGRYNSEDLRGYAARSDMAAFPSRAEESYGLVVEEALALGLPTWVSDRGALPEVLANMAGRGPLPGGILPAESPESWAQLFRELVKHPERLQDAASAVPDQTQPAERATELTLELYESILGGQSARHP